MEGLFKSTNDRNDVKLVKNVCVHKKKKYLKDSSLILNHEKINEFL